MSEKSKTLRLVRDVLDTELVDRKDCPLGRADGIVILAESDSQPRIAWIEVGTPVLARRIGRRFEKVFRAIVRRMGMHRAKRYRIPWNRIESFGLELKIDLDAERSPTLAWERWLRRIFSHIPGGKSTE